MPNATRVHHPAVTTLVDAADALRADWGEEWQASDPASGYHLALADVLADTAVHAAEHVEAWQRPGTTFSPAAVAHDDPQRLDRLVEHHYGATVTLARLYLDARGLHRHP